MPAPHSALCVTMTIICVLSAQASDAFRPQIPKTWDDTEMGSVEIPLSHKEYSPKHVSADFYYRIPVRPMYQSYPVYHPHREPAGYVEWLRGREPRLIWDRSKLRTREDWIQAGEFVFDSPIAYGAIAVGPGHSEQLYVRSRSWYKKVNPPLSRDGVLPFMRYIVRQKGKVEIGILACAMCHTRVLSDGSILKRRSGELALRCGVRGKH